MDYANEIGPREVMSSVQRGMKRLQNFKAARVHFLREYSGPYYDRSSGEIGTSSINLIFNAIRVLVPTLVMSFPKHTIETPYLALRQYANLLGLALDQHDLKIDIRNIYRRVIVDAIFTLGILKTGIAQSDSIYALDADMKIDPGTVYTEAVDFDNFVADPASQEFMFRDARFVGDRMCVPRSVLLQSGQYKNDLVERLPRAGDASQNKKASDISMRNTTGDDNYELEDEVEVVEIYVPSAKAIITVPGDESVQFDDYLRVTDYYGVDEGPYTLLSLTPPVPGNPLPIPMVGVWYDLHMLANRMAKKVIEQADRQKTIIAYTRSAADDAVELKNAADGEAVAVDDPQNVATLNFGGQQNSNESHLQNLTGWFNMMAANPNQIGGQGIDAKSATAANILQSNASIGLEDMKDLVYQMAAGEARKRAWFFHTDPLMQVPLIQRQEVQKPILTPTPQGPQWLSMPMMQDVQVVLTPEARGGNFIDFVFTIQPESLGRQDSKTRLAQAMAFAQQVAPAVAAAAQIFSGLGVPFSAIAFLLRMAKDMGITWMDEVLFDPNYQQQLLMQMAAGPQMSGSKGTAQPNPGLAGQLQNGQPGTVQGSQPTPDQQQNAGQQEGANDSQRVVRSMMTRSVIPAPQSRTASILQ